MRARLAWLALMFSLAGCYRTSGDPADRDAEVPRDAAPPGDPSIDLPACDEWCWFDGAPVVKLDAASASSVWAIDEGGNVLHWSGETWETQLLGGALRDLYVQNDGAVWVLSDARIWRYDGSAWSVVHERGGWHLGVANERDLWLASSDGIERWDGTRWEVTLPNASALDLYVSSRGEAWGELFGVDEDGAPGAYRFDGTAWARVGEPHLTYGGFAELDGEVVRVGGAAVRRWDGSAWVEVALDASDALVWRDPPLFGEGRQQVLTRGGVVDVSTAGNCGSRLVRVAEEAFCADHEGRIRHFAGGDASRSTREPQAPSDADWGTLPPALWAGDAEVAWGTSPSDLLRARDVGDREVLEHFDGTAWTELASGWFSEIDGSSSDDVWIAGSTPLRYDGRTVSAIELPPELAAAELHNVHAIAPGVSLWTARLETRVLVLRYDGAWTVLHEVERGPEAYSIFLRPITAVGDEIWAAGWEQPNARAPGPAFVLHFDGERWSRHQLGETWSVQGLVTDGERFWLSASDALHDEAIAPAPEDEAALARFEIVPVGISMGTLWLGSRDLWTTRGVQSMHRAR